MTTASVSAHCRNIKRFTTSSLALNLAWNGTGRLAAERMTVHNSKSSPSLWSANLSVSLDINKIMGYGRRPIHAAHETASPLCSFDANDGPFVVTHQAGVSKGTLKELKWRSGFRAAYPHGRQLQRPFLVGIASAHTHFKINDN